MVIGKTDFGNWFDSCPVGTVVLARESEEDPNEWIKVSDTEIVRRLINNKNHETFTFNANAISSCLIEILDWFDDQVRPELTLEEKKRILNSGLPVILKQTGAHKDLYIFIMKQKTNEYFQLEIGTDKLRYHGEGYAKGNNAEYYTWISSLSHWVFVDYFEEALYTKFIVHKKGCKTEVRLLFGCNCGD